MAAPALLGHLAQFGSLCGQAELLCTQGLAYLLRTHADARAALASAVASRTGVQTGSQLTWSAEVTQGDRSRPDLEARRSDGVPVVKVEAKLGAELGPKQLQSYFTDLQRHGSSSVLLVVVPTRRTGEACRTAAAALGLHGPGPWLALAPNRPGVAVFAWDELFAALVETGSVRLIHEVEQLQAMYRVLIGDHIAPLAGVEELRNWRERESDFVNLVDQATRRLTTHHKVYPMQVEAPEHVPDGLEPRGFRRRYVCRPHGGGTACFCIGVRDSFAEWITPVWLRFSQDTRDFVSIRVRLASSSLRWLDSGGDLWLPVEIPLGMSGERMVAAVVDQAEAAVRVAFQGG